MMKNIIKILMITALFSLVLHAEETKNDRWAIDAVNHQKVLTQQILKEYAFFGMKNRFKNSKEQLKKHLLNYEEELSELETYLANKPDALVYLKEVREIWEPVNKIFKKTPKKNKVGELQKKTDKILTKMSGLMKLLLSNSSEGNNKIINISGYQGVIVERMAALYMMKTWGVNDPKFDFKMRESITFFNNTLYKMLDSPLTTSKNKKMVKKVMRGFKFFEIMNRSKTKFIPTLIYSKTGKIHSDIKKITALYIKSEGK